MAQMIGPEVGQVTYKPVIEIADSRKNEDAVTLKIAGSFGNTEFTADEVVTIYTYLSDFLKMKGLDPEREAAANRFVDGGFLGDSLREGESLTVSGSGVESFTIHGSN